MKLPTASSTPPPLVGTLNPSLLPQPTPTETSPKLLKIKVPPAKCKQIPHYISAIPDHQIKFRPLRDIPHSLLPFTWKCIIQQFEKDFSKDKISKILVDSCHPGPGSQRGCAWGQIFREDEVDDEPTEEFPSGLALGDNGIRVNTVKSAVLSPATIAISGTLLFNPTNLEKFSFCDGKAMLPLDGTAALKNSAFFPTLEQLTFKPVDNEGHRSYKCIMPKPDPDRPNSKNSGLQFAHSQAAGGFDLLSEVMKQTGVADEYIPSCSSTNFAPYMAVQELSNSEFSNNNANHIDQQRVLMEPPSSVNSVRSSEVEVNVTDFTDDEREPILGDPLPNIDSNSAQCTCNSINNKNVIHTLVDSNLPDLIRSSSVCAACSKSSASTPAVNCGNSSPAYTVYDLDSGRNVVPLQHTRAAAPNFDGRPLDLSRSSYDVNTNGTRTPKKLVPSSASFSSLCQHLRSEGVDQFPSVGCEGEMGFSLTGTINTLDSLPILGFSPMKHLTMVDMLSPRRSPLHELNQLSLQLSPFLNEKSPSYCRVLSNPNSTVCTPYKKALFNLASDNDGFTVDNEFESHHSIAQLATSPQSIVDTTNVSSAANIPTVVDSTALPSACECSTAESNKSSTLTTVSCGLQGFSDITSSGMFHSTENSNEEEHEVRCENSQQQDEGNHNRNITPDNCNLVVRKDSPGNRIPTLESDTASANTPDRSKLSGMNGNVSPNNSQRITSPNVLNKKTPSAIYCNPEPRSDLVPVPRLTSSSINPASQSILRNLGSRYRSSGSSTENHFYFIISNLELLFTSAVCEEFMYGTRHSIIPRMSRDFSDIESAIEFDDSDSDEASDCTDEEIATNYEENIAAVVHLFNPEEMSEVIYKIFQNLLSLESSENTDSDSGIFPDDVDSLVVESRITTVHDEALETRSVVTQHSNIECNTKLQVTKVILSEETARYRTSKGGNGSSGNGNTPNTPASCSGDASVPSSVDSANVGSSSRGNDDDEDDEDNSQNRRNLNRLPQSLGGQVDVNEEDEDCDPSEKVTTDIITETISTTTTSTISTTSVVFPSTSKIPVTPPKMKIMSSRLSPNSKGNRLILPRPFFHPHSPLKKIVSPILRKYRRLSPVKTRARVKPLLAKFEQRSAKKSPLTLKHAFSKSIIPSNSNVEGDNDLGNVVIDGTDLQNEGILAPHDFQVSRKRKRLDFDGIDKERTNKKLALDTAYDEGKEELVDEDQLEAFLRSSTTIEAKKSGKSRTATKSSWKRSARERKLLQEDVLALTREHDLPARHKLFAGLYLQRVWTRIQKDMEQLQQFLLLLHSALNNEGSVEELYSSITQDVLKDHPDLAAEFIAFLLPHQAIELGVFDLYSQQHRLLEVLYQLHLVHQTQPHRVQKILRRLAAFHRKLQLLELQDPTPSIAGELGTNSGIIESSGSDAVNVPANSDKDTADNGTFEDFKVPYPPPPISKPKPIGSNNGGNDEVDMETLEFNVGSSCVSSNDTGITVPDFLPTNARGQTVNNAEETVNGSNPKCTSTEDSSVIESQSVSPLRSSVDKLLKEMTSLLRPLPLLNAFKNWLPGIPLEKGLEDDYEEVVIDDTPDDGDYENIQLPDKPAPKRGNYKRKTVASIAVSEEPCPNPSTSADKLEFAIDNLTVTSKSNCFCPCHETNNPEANAESSSTQRSSGIDRQPDAASSCSCGQNSCSCRNNLTSSSKLPSSDSQKRLPECETESQTDTNSSNSNFVNTSPVHSTQTQGAETGVDNPKSNGPYSRNNSASSKQSKDATGVDAEEPEEGHSLRQKPTTDTVIMPLCDECESCGVKIMNGEVYVQKNKCLLPAIVQPLFCDAPATATKSGDNEEAASKIPEENSTSDSATNKRKLAAKADMPTTPTSKGKNKANQKVKDNKSKPDAPSKDKDKAVKDKLNVSCPAKRHSEKSTASVAKKFKTNSGAALPCVTERNAEVVPCANDEAKNSSKNVANVPVPSNSRSKNLAKSTLSTKPLFATDNSLSSTRLSDTKISITKSKTRSKSSELSEQLSKPSTSNIVSSSKFHRTGKSMATFKILENSDSNCRLNDNSSNPDDNAADTSHVSGSSESNSSESSSDSASSDESVAPVGVATWKVEYLPSTPGKKKKMVGDDVGYNRAQPPEYSTSPPTTTTTLNSSSQVQTTISVSSSQTDMIAQLQTPTTTGLLSSVISQSPKNPKPVIIPQSPMMPQSPMNPQSQSPMMPQSPIVSTQSDLWTKDEDLDVLLTIQELGPTAESFQSVALKIGRGKTPQQIEERFFLLLNAMMSSES